MNGTSYLLIRRFPDGSIHSNTKPIRGRKTAASAAATILRMRAGEVYRQASHFAAALARQPDGAIWGHASGYDFRMLVPDYTADGAAITPGLRVFNLHDREWGTIEPLQFMDQGLNSPGAPGFDGHYFFQKQDERYATRKFRGDRLSTQGPLR